MVFKDCFNVVSNSLYIIINKYMWQFIPFDIPPTRITNFGSGASNLQLTFSYYIRNLYTNYTHESYNCMTSSVPVQKVH